MWSRSRLPVETQQQTVQTVAWFLLGATPILIALAALAVWILVGRALPPVERVRATVSTIDAQRLAQRIVVPPSRDEIAALAATMNVMLDRLEAADSHSDRSSRTPTTSCGAHSPR